MRRWIVAAAALAALPLLAIDALASPHRDRGEGSIPWFMSLSDDTLVAALVECRGDLRKAETPICGNAEIAANRLYTKRLAKDRFGFLQSPLYWLENPEMAANVREACSGNRGNRSDRMLLRYCHAVSRVPVGRRT